MPDVAKLVRRTLANGLDVLLYPTFDAPVATFQVWYRVGSRDELPGITGASHWVEHMMFKGTERIGPGQIMLQINENGGELNAFTSYDYTAYHETMPADRIGIAIAIEADRMTGLLIDPEETASERTVILSERQGALNNPSYLLWDETIGLAFREHSYGHFVIGTEHDLKTMNRDDLYNHYRSFYAPNNAVVVVAGAFDADHMMEQIESTFGAIPAAPEIRRTTVNEPKQTAERRTLLRHPAPAPEALVAWHVPGAGNEDEMAFEMLNGILSGAGGRMGRSARLPRNLVATGKARGAHAMYLRGFDPFVFLVGASGLPDGDPVELEIALLDQVEDIKANGVTDEEVARTAKLLKAAFHLGSESVSALANGIGEAAMYGDPARFFSWPDDLAKVTPAQIQAAANTWLIDNNRTTGLLYPTVPSSGGELDEPFAALRFGLGGIGAPKLRPFERIEVEPGLVVLGQAQPTDPTVTARIRINAGSADDPAGKRGVGNLAGVLAMRGTTSRSREEFEEACDDLGASIGVSVGREHTEFSVTSLAEDLVPALDLLAEAWSAPAFSDDQMELARRESVAAIRQLRDRTDQVADQLLRDQLYPAGHPLQHRAVGVEADLGSITRDDVVGFYDANVRARAAAAVVVGGIDDLASTAEAIQSRFGGRTAKGDRLPYPPAKVLGDGNAQTALLPGKEQADIAIGIPVLARIDPDWYAWRVADAILGEFGMMGRIGDRVRQQQGLAYYAYCNTTPRLDGSIWSARAGVDPDNIDRAINSVRDVVVGAIANGFSEAEVAGTIRLLTGRLALGMETNAGIASILLQIEEFGLGLDYVERYPEIIGAVTADKAKAVIEAWLDPAKFRVAIARPS
jgi:zinc protease